MGRDYYKILGISKTANDDEIRKAYRVTNFSEILIIILINKYIETRLEMAS